MQPPLDPKPKPSVPFSISLFCGLFLLLTSTSLPRGGGGGNCYILLLFARNNKSSGPSCQVSLLSAAFCFAGFQSQIETQALALGFCPDPLAPGS